jgi:hypothetical protein
MKSGVPDKLCSCNEECLNIPTGGSLGGRLLLGHWVSCDDECCMLLLSDMIARESLDDDATVFLLMVKEQANCEWVDDQKPLQCVGDAI